MDLTTPRYERREGPLTHRCNPPGWWRRWRDGVKPGAIWRCACGERYEFRPERLAYPGIHQAGQERAPWWHLFEMGPPPKRVDWSDPPIDEVLDAVLGPPGKLTDQVLG